MKQQHNTARKYLNGDETGGSIRNSPTKIQLKVINEIELYHPEHHKFYGATSAEAYSFIAKYYAVAHEIELSLNSLPRRHTNT